MKLTDKHRPRIFEDLIGQEAVGRWLARQVRAGTGKSVLLHGPAGLGKTSAARIYAQALQCERVCETGSPCLTCEECVAFMRPGGHPSHIELDCARFGRFEDVEENLKALRSHPIFGRRWVVTLNEAHRASLKALDAVNTQLEEPPPWAAFTIVAPEIDKLPPAIISRCETLEFRPISFEMGLLHLRKLCELEKIPYKLEGLALIAEVSRGEVREMVTRLDQVSEGTGDVTEQEVRRLFNLDYVDTVVEYIRAVLAGDLQLQLSIIDRWRDQPLKKAEAIEAVLAFLFTTGVLRLRRQDRIINAMGPADQEWIVAEMRARAAAAADVDEREFWQEIVDFWRPGGSEFTDATLVAKVVKFDTLLNIERRLGSPARAVREMMSGTMDHMATTAATAVEHSDASPLASSSNAHLTKSQARKLWDAGSFLVQEYGILLNTRIVINHPGLSISENREGAQLVSALVHELGMALKRSAPRSCPHFHWLYAHQLGWKTGFSTTLVAYIPEALVDEAHEHLFDRFLTNWCGWPLPNNAVLLRTTRYETRIWRVRRHFQLMRMLCRSVDPNIKVRDQGERRALIDVLRIPRRLRETFGSFEVPQTCRVSETIGAKMQHKAAEDRLAPVSAFGDRAWSYLFAGWELDEYVDRLLEKHDDEQARLKIDLEFPAGLGPLHDRARAAAIERLKNSRHKDPRRRLRTWKGWWL